jgi:hypothetical protein
VSDIPIYTPSEWGESHWFFEGIEDRQQRRALALISHFGTPGGGDKVAFIADQIVIAVQPEPGVTDNVDLVIRPLDEFVKDYSLSIERDADPMALRWVEKIVHWPELGC